MKESLKDKELRKFFKKEAQSPAPQEPQRSEEPNFEVLTEKFANDMKNGYGIDLRQPDKDFFLHLVKSIYYTGTQKATPQQIGRELLKDAVALLARVHNALTMKTGFMHREKWLKDERDFMERYQRAKSREKAS